MTHERSQCKVRGSSDPAFSLAHFLRQHAKLLRIASSLFSSFSIMSANLLKSIVVFGDSDFEVFSGCIYTNSGDDGQFPSSSILSLIFLRAASYFFHILAFQKKDNPHI